jgi:hypothetical protein
VHVFVLSGEWEFKATSIYQWFLQLCDGKVYDTVLHGTKVIFFPFAPPSCQEMRWDGDVWTVITFGEGSRATGHPTPLRQLLACTLQIAACPSELLVTANVRKAFPYFSMEIYPASAID